MGVAHLGQEWGGEEFAAHQRGDVGVEVLGGGDHVAGAGQQGEVLAGDVYQLGLAVVGVAVVAVGVRAGELRAVARYDGSGEPERADDPAAYLVGVRVAGDLLDQEEGEGVVGVGVVLVGAGGEARRLGEGEADELFRGVAVEAVVDPFLADDGDAGDDCAVVVQLAGVGEQPAGVLQQHPRGDPPIQAEPRQVAGHWVVQLDLALGDELQDDGCGDGLGDAADPERSVRRRLGRGPELPHAGAADPLTLPVIHPHLDPAESGIDKRLHRSLYLRPTSRYGARRARHRQPGEHPHGHRRY